MKCKIKMIYKDGIVDVPDEEEFIFNVDEFEINENADFILRANGKIIKTFSLEICERIMVKEEKVEIKNVQLRKE